MGRTRRMLLGATTSTTSAFCACATASAGALTTSKLPPMLGGLGTPPAMKLPTLGVAPLSTNV
ncbi:MAG: hypothetical protein HC853_02945 [Anaerolineae bacterium]|nr:hypothetical protein [Anaerolineae bacterium]